ncbi:phenylalanine--tRNA ligase subunit beta [Bacteroidales bacterium OttesenSCG-928-C03]|nr:phenylalanine--tRNA ligase subunit beta [Bacteroidales bacterium OttesenSCG-928-C03]MDL2325948.1 phenylalanine--tRNA ligase subunit beta [Bacteroidales bacterium OttesenSCG-928-A14]
MKISWNWLKEYVHFDLTPQETAKYLTDCGLEVDGIEQFEAVKGGLKGLLVGEILTCEAHPNSDHLHITTVKIGEGDPLHIVCGAANVAKGQKVIVATIGTTLYSGNESFTIKKSKIRGELSEGMICAEDEIGLSNSHDGIMVLDDSAVPGTTAADFFNLPTDYTIEIGLTPNRSDAMSHLGVARELAAVLNTHGIPCSGVLYPQAPDFIPNAKKNPIDITIENTEACPRYIGLSFENVTVKESPDWLKNRLLSIGIRPINNVVDITQFVMFEIGQPLHAFDANYIKDGKVIVKNLPEGTPFVTLDGAEVKLSKEDLMICNAKEGMCIAGVYGGLHSGVTEMTKSVFLESAYFNPISVRKTSKRHHLKTDAAFRYERGVDPDTTLYAIRRAANLIQELTGATIVSEIIDVYPKEIELRKVKLSLPEVYQVAGKEIPRDEISSILLLLGMEVHAAGEEQLLVTVPHNRVDVTRSIDLIEEILRIYGYNNIEIPQNISYQFFGKTKSTLHTIQKNISTFLVERGYYEVMNNSLTKGTYSDDFPFIDSDKTVKLLNPLSSELNVMRQTLLFSLLENISRNINNKNSDLCLFEFGNVYEKSSETSDDVAKRYTQSPMLAMAISGNTGEEQWNTIPRKMSFFDLKNSIENMLLKLNVPKSSLTYEYAADEMFLQNMIVKSGEQILLKSGEIHPKTLKYFDIKKSVYFAEISMEVLAQVIPQRNIEFQEVPLYPSVKRDLALVVDKKVTYAELEKIAFKYGSKLLKQVTLFDVYEGDKIESGKKSYALGFLLQHSSKTLTEDEISKMMTKLIDAFDKEAGAKLR